MRFQPEIDRWSDGSGKVVRLTGTIATTCNTPADVEVSITGTTAEGRTIDTRTVWLPLPPGGGPFELLGRVPYNPAVARYEAAIVRTR